MVYLVAACPPPSFFKREQIPYTSKIVHTYCEFIKSIVKFILSSILKELKILCVYVNHLVLGVSMPQSMCKGQRTTQKSSLLKPPSGVPETELWLWFFRLGSRCFNYDAPSLLLKELLRF